MLTHDKIARAMLMMAAGVLVGSAALLVYVAFPWSCILPVWWLLHRRGKVALWAHGTARTATRQEIRHLINAEEGVPVGVLTEKPLWEERIAALFDRRASDSEAVGRFFGRPETVRLKDAVHVCVCAPTRAGKGASIIVPFLKGLK